MSSDASQEVPSKDKFNQPPEQKIQSPEQEIQSPEQEIQSPEQEIQSPEQEIQSPEQEIESPAQEIQSPEQEIQSHEQEIQSPEQDIQSPEQEVQSPKQGIVSPEQSEGEPKSEEASLKESAEDSAEQQHEQQSQSAEQKQETVEEQDVKSALEGTEDPEAEGSQHGSDTLTIKRSAWDETSTVDVLPDLCYQWSHILKPTDNSVIKRQVQTIHGTIEATITRLDEFGALVESIRTNSLNASTIIIPNLLEQSEILQHTFNQIDDLQMFLNIMEKSVEKCEKRMTQVAAVYDKSTIRNRFSRFMGRSSPSTMEWEAMNIVEYDDFFKDKPEIQL